MQPIYNTCILLFPLRFCYRTEGLSVSENTWQLMLTLPWVLLQMTHAWCSDSEEVSEYHNATFVSDWVTAALHKQASLCVLQLFKALVLCHEQIFTWANLWAWLFLMSVHTTPFVYMHTQILIFMVSKHFGTWLLKKWPVVLVTFQINTST